MANSDFFYALFAAPFMGSFLGVLVLRLPAGETVAFGRSRCGHCQHVLTAVDLVPLLSWLANGARCRHCAAPLSIFYPGVELAAVLVVFWAGQAVSGWLLWATCGLGWTLLALALIDQRHLILPDKLTLPLIPAGLLVGWAIDPTTLLDHVIGAGVGGGMFLLTREVYARLRGREGLGLGDVKLMAAAGAWVSWQALPSVLLIAAICGLANAALLAARGRSTRPGGHIPFGPCICLAVWLVWIYGPLQLG